MYILHTASFPCAAAKKCSMIVIFFPLLFSCFFAFLAASTDTLDQGNVLNSTTYLISSKKIFTLGFFTPSQYSNDTYLAIWYTNQEDRPVWIFNRESPISNQSAALTIDNYGKLIMTYHGGDPIVIYASQAGTNIAATLLDSGNFVVREANHNGNSTEQIKLWQSFDLPSDTLLPGMKLGANRRTGRNWTVTSWFADDVPASGAFTLEWDPVKQRLVVSRRGVIAWTSGALKDKAFEFIVPRPDPLNLNYNFINVSNQDEEYFTYSLIVDPFQTPEDRKVISGWRLGYEGTIDDFSGRPVIAQAGSCNGFNTRISNIYGGCELWEQPKCRNQFQKLDLRSGSFSQPPSSFNHSQTLSFIDCWDVCWKECDCVGFWSWGGRTGCEFWKGSLAFEQDYSGLTSRHYVLVSETPKKRERKWKWIVPTAVVAVLILLLVVLCYFRRRRIRLQFENREEKALLELMSLDGYVDMDELDKDGTRGHAFRVFSFASIMAATDGFSLESKLGEGGFGPVFKGKLPEGREIAVKRLARSSAQGLVEFKNELILIAKLQHTNLVRLLGCCIQGDEKILVYEYMPNKSLDSILFDTTKKEELTWEKRMKIIVGIAQGLLYLHKFSRLRIIHRDLKASNVLLDKNMNPKISDFGMARIYRQDVLEVNTNRIVGTYGYMAPKYAMEGIFSVKSDVFSFGVLILEIVSGRKNSSFYHDTETLNLVGYAWELWNREAALELMDLALCTSCAETQILRCIHVGLLCVEDRAVDRPTMSDVNSMLTNDRMALPLPKNPAFITGRHGVEEDMQQTKSKKYSVNGVSISVMNPR